MGGLDHTDLKAVEKYYNDCKLIVLKWEKAFTVSESRQPNKSDMLQAPSRVKQAYEKYCKYKKVVAKLRAKAAKEGKNSKLVINTTPQKIFRSLSFRSKSTGNDAPPGTSEPKKQLKKPATFGRKLSEKLFSFEPSIKKKELKKSTSNANQLGEQSDCISGEPAPEALSSYQDAPGTENGGMDSGISSENSNPMETDSEERLDNVETSAVHSIIMEDTIAFDDDDDFRVDSSFFSNFLEESDSIMDAFNRNEPMSGNPYNGLPPTTPDFSNNCANGIASAQQQTIGPVCLGEEVRKCLNAVNSCALDENAMHIDEDTFFPSSSFVLRNTVPAIAQNVNNVDSGLDVTLPFPWSFGNSTIQNNSSLEPTPICDTIQPKHNKENEVNQPPGRASTPSKRKYNMVFSPSPKKEVKRKFFKTSKTARLNDRKALTKPKLPETKVALQKTVSMHAQSDGAHGSANIFENYDTTPDQQSAAQIGNNSSTTLQFNGDEPVVVTASSKRNPVSKKKDKLFVEGGGSRKKVASVSSKKSCNKREPIVNPSSASNLVTDVFTDDQPLESVDPKAIGKKRPLKSRPAKTVNENYVSIDVQKKVFVRKKKGITGWKAKRLDWKKKKSIVARENKLNSLTCRKCGDIGHFSKFCPKRTFELEKEALSEVIDDSPWPTLEEAAQMAWNKHEETSTTRVSIYPSPCEMQSETQDAIALETNTGDGSSENLNMIQSSFKLVAPTIGTVPPYFDPEDNLGDANVTEKLEQALKAFGYSSFRPGQREAVFRILKGESTLLTLSTGSGKSLCYQLPAYLYSMKYPGCITVCISPLISLMEDQVESMPTFLPAAGLSRNTTDKKKEAILAGIRAKKYKVLLVSPEAVSAGIFGLLRDPEHMPPVAFACIDEAHCVTEWSHNFRPAYFQVCKLLREKLGVSTLLGLTATATVQTISGICDQLQITSENVIKGEFIPKNLKLSVSRDLDRDVALIRLLNGDRFRESESIIIYCTRREECNRIAELVRVYTKPPSSDTLINGKSRGKISSICEPYHAGLSAAKRTSIQKNFMQGKIRTVVATVAFGMGIDKSDIRAVIHYNMPQTFESYVQEIGRAGRDGEAAHCHLFLDHTKGRDLAELKRHVFANSIDRVTVRKLLKKIFRPCVCKKVDQLNSSQAGAATAKSCPGHEVTFGVQRTVQELDLPEENIETLLCYLENDNQKFLQILPKTYETCKIHSYGGARLLKATALKCPPLAVGIALAKEKGKFSDEDTYIEINYVEAASSVGWNSAVVRKELKGLEWVGSEFNSSGQPTKFRKSGLIVEFCDLAFRCRAKGDLTSEEHEHIFNTLCNFNANQERRQLFQLHKVYQCLLSVSSPGVSQAEDECNEEHSNSLRSMIEEYFSDTCGVPADWKAPSIGSDREEEVRREVRNLLASYKEDNFTGRSVARIFQGISSPNFQAIDWCRNKSFWRRFVDIDFHFLTKVASEEIVSHV